MKKKVKKEPEAIQFAAWAAKYFKCDLIYWKIKVGIKIPFKHKKGKIYTTEKLFKLWKKQTA